MIFGSRPALSSPEFLRDPSIAQAKVARQHMPTAAQSRANVSAKATVELAKDALLALSTEELVSVFAAVLDVRRDMSEPQLNKISNHAANIPQRRARGLV